MRRSLILAAVVLMLAGVGGGLAVGRASAGDAPPPAPPAPPAPAPKADLPRQTIDLGGGVTFEMVLIPAGEFDMGSPETEEGRHQDETLHRVQLTKPFWMATTELTQAAWAAVMGANPSTTKDPALPVTDVSWDDCQSFVKRLNEKVAGGGFRLPTEAEWEYACRAGSTTRFCSGDDERVLAEYAWYEATSEKAVHPVGLLKPNAWDLQDMHGNVWEWCEDWHGEYATGEVVDPRGPGNGTGRANRGGSRISIFRFVRSANRRGESVGVRSDDMGLRLARQVELSDRPPPIWTNPPPAQPPAPAPKPGDPAPPVAPPAKEGEVPSWAKVAPEQVEAARKAGVPVAFENSIGMRFVLIPAGTFTMGTAPDRQDSWHSGEEPRTVRLTRPYYLQATEVTNAQYRRFDPRHSSGAWDGRDLDGDEQPVVMVSWEQAVAFARWLTRVDAHCLAQVDPTGAYRLPTSAEWEHACRAGTQTAFWTGDTIGPAQANLQFQDPPGRPTADFRRTTVPVGTLPANPWGLHEVHGNAAELVQDWFWKRWSGPTTDPTGPRSGECHESRGGSWMDPDAWCRSACHDMASREREDCKTGFRVALSVEPGTPAPPGPAGPRPGGVREPRPDDGPR